ncbi:mammalian cell entry protein [Mycolicibacterium conceptionense]|jgi:virulence factor Mce-like protein|uniref:Mammalian cell entry protein n=2 Tax=Mycolicibacterium TaxID=1866885 RepID=A0A0J8WRL0_9MYCO|nr:MULTISPECIES: MCE family protein [Mycolicibacterium]KLI05064.1 mammalian cell entry protein [Mycolicibacterium senegalense]KLO51997.1 mammalian cell entry protein [Mycolicibacterium senegalense]KMV15644.1 mammalian cell entry protein [Mycolicibacterium conceptionense]MCW1822555.1 MCE family protein [Mycolicibacterium senegalense]OBB09707.1 mammalian cell entry protein [Mycolicibacterium conceptionense]
MGNSLETDGRGPSDRQLLACGAAVLVVAGLVSAFLLVKATGRLDARVPVVAALVNVGDGLPQRSDVKYHGVLVGMVDDVVPAANGDPNFVHIDLKPEYAGSIPNTVTARVVPSNVFAVSSVQLVDRGDGAAPAIAAGAQIPEDTELPTVLFQTTISKLRDVLAATGRGREDKTVGILAAVNAATENRRTELLTSGAQLNHLIDQLDAVVATEPGPTTVSALIDATQGLQQTAPDLLDALHKAVEPMQTLVEQRAQLNTMINAGINTIGTTHTALDNHTDQLVKTTANLTPVLGVLADISNNWVPAFVKLNQLSGKFFEHVWIAEHDFGNMRINLSFTPSYSYTRADCPQYAGLKGPSCFTAPLVPTRPSLPDVLLPQNYQPPADLVPPPGTQLDANGNLVAVGPPLVNPNPNLADPNPPLPPWMPPSGPVPGTANPALAPTPPPPVPLAPLAPVAPRPPGSPPAATIPGSAPPPNGAPPPAPAGPLLPAEAAPAAGQPVSGEGGQ